MQRARYLAPFLLLAFPVAGMALGGWWTWTLPVVIFGLIPVLDQVLPASTANLDAEGEQAALSDRFYDAVLYVWVPIQLAIVAATVVVVAQGGHSVFELAGMVFSAGIFCAGFGLNVGHELGHRRSTLERRLAKVLFGSSLYVHFYIEHNRGHHRRIGTPEDPATARRGEVLYAFWFRSVVGGWRSAWDLEASRLRRAGLPVWSHHNEMLRDQVAQGVVLAGAFAVFGLAAFAWVGAALSGVLLLETVNYIEHYGLVRQKNARGVYERVRPEHSWNADYAAGRVLLFELTRHSDHHANATRKYQVLRSMEDVPTFPAGYPAMILLALVPPLWFRAVHPRLDQHLALAA